MVKKSFGFGWSWGKKTPGSVTRVALFFKSLDGALVFGVFDGFAILAAYRIEFQQFAGGNENGALADI